MRIRIVMVGRVRERYLQAGIQEYLKRLRPYAKIEMLSVDDEPASDGAPQATIEQVKAKESERVLKLVDSGQFVVALDARGQQLSSDEFAEFLAKRALHGESSLAFIIGGSHGLAPAVFNRADQLLSLGRMTLPHQMVPLVLLEQVYRGFKINRGEPYHK